MAKKSQINRWKRKPKFCSKKCAEQQTYLKEIRKQFQEYHPKELNQLVQEIRSIEFLKKLI